MKLSNQDIFASSMPPIVTATRSTVASQVYQTIRENIINLRLVPGMSMSEHEMSSTLGVSRTPVREAFIRLSREGLIIIYPQRCTVVSKLSLERVIQERFLRESLERSVLETFILSPTEAGFARMQEQIDVQRRCLETQDYETFLSSDDRFHFTMYEETGNQLCSQIIRRNCHDYQRLRVLSSKVNQEIQLLNIEQHELILDAIHERNVLKAQELLCKHVRRLLSEIEMLRSVYPDYITETNDVLSK